MQLYYNNFSMPKAGFSYNNSVSFQTDDADHVGAAAVLAHVAYVVGLQTNVRHNISV